MKAVWTILLTIAFLQSSPAPDTQTSLPPRPPSIYDPQPGPYIVVGHDDLEKFRETADTVSRLALRGWSPKEVDSLGAFLLCFRSVDGRTTSARLEHRTLSIAAAALQKAGATSVVVGTWNICRALPRVEFADEQRLSYWIEIRGVVRPDEG